MGESQDRALALEREVKTLIAGVLTPGSGNKQIKGDARSVCYHVEAKYRSRRVDGVPLMPLDLDWLETLDRQKGERVPVLALEWADGRRLLLLPTLSWEVQSGEPAASLPFQVLGRCPLLIYPGITPASYEFPALLIPTRSWSGLDWGTFADLRRAAQPRKESTSFRRTESGFRSRPSAWSPRGFRKRS